MNIFQNKIILFILAMIIVNPVFALDFYAVDNNSSSKSYTSTPAPQPKSEPVKVQEQIQQPVQQTVQTVQEQPVTIQNYEKLPNVPKLPDKAFSKSVAPINTMYTGKNIDKNAIVPCNNIKVEELILDDKYKTPVKTKIVNLVTPKPSTTKTTTTKPKTVVAPNYRYRKLPKGMQFRVVNSSKITDYMSEGQRIVFKSTQAVKTPYVNIPANTKFIGVIEDVHRPQMTCNGGLIAIRMVSAEINGHNQSIDGTIIKVNTNRVRLGNLKGAHTYLKTTCKKAKWGQNKFKQYSKTASRLADKGAGIVVAPFPYLSGCVLACASTVTSPITALLGKGGSLTVPANTVFTIKLNEEAKIRY